MQKMGFLLQFPESLPLSTPFPLFFCVCGFGFFLNGWYLSQNSESGEVSAGVGLADNLLPVNVY